MIILYPTETIYALGVNAFAPEALAELFELKGREVGKTVSILVRDMHDVERYAICPPKAQFLADRFLPGPLTLVLKARDEVPRQLLAPDQTIGFRISSDKVAQKLIAEFMFEHNSPLTCTSANLSGVPTQATVPEILNQFGSQAKLITKIYDDGPRSSLSSTIIKIEDDKVEVLRSGVISEQEIYSVLDKAFKVQS